MAQYRASGGVWVLVEVVGSLVGWRLPGAWPVRAVLSEAFAHIVSSAYCARRSRLPGARSLRDEVLRSEVVWVDKDQLLGSGGWGDARGAGVSGGCRASRRRSRGPMRHRGAARGRSGPAAASGAPGPRVTDVLGPQGTSARSVWWDGPFRGVLLPRWAVGGGCCLCAPSHGWVHVVLLACRCLCSWWVVGVVDRVRRPVCTGPAPDVLGVVVRQRERGGAGLLGPAPSPATVGCGAGLAGAGPLWPAARLVPGGFQGGVSFWFRAGWVGSGSLVRGCAGSGLILLWLGRWQEGVDDARGRLR